MQLLFAAFFGSDLWRPCRQKQAISFIILNCISKVNKFNEKNHFSLIQLRKQNKFDGRKIIVFLLNLEIIQIIFIKCPYEIITNVVENTFL